MLMAMIGLSSCADQQGERVSAPSVSQPYKVIVSHRDDASYMEVYQGNELHLFKQMRDQKQWEPMLQWQDYDRSWEHRIDRKVKYFSVQAGGKLSFYDAKNWQLLYSVNLVVKRGGTPSFYKVTDSMRLLAVPYVNEAGQARYDMHISVDGKHWQPLNIDGFEYVKGIRHINEKQFAMRDQSGKWHFLSIDGIGKTSPVVIPGLPDRIDVIKVSWNHSWFAVGQFIPALNKSGDRGFAWHLFSFGSGAWQKANEATGFDARHIANIARFSKDIVLLEPRQSSGHKPAYKYRYFEVDAEQGWKPLQQAVPDLPAKINTVKSIGDDSLLAVTEADDANGNGVAGEYFWFIRGVNHSWQSVRKVLPGAPARIWDAVAWNNGNGLGIQESGDQNGDGEAFGWFWYLRGSDGKWQTAQSVIPGFPDHGVYSIRDVRDGLVEIHTDKASQWLMHVKDGSWHNIHQMIKTVTGNDHAIVVTADARSNALLLDVRHSKGSQLAVRELYYYARNGSWVKFNAETLSGGT